MKIYPVDISFVVAAAENNIIGDGKTMPWHLPNDLKFFKQKTLHHSVLMGRKTFQTLAKPLVDRRNIVITRNYNFKAEGVDVANSLEEAIGYCRDENEIFIIGGGEIYKEAMPIVDRIYLTRVHTEAEGSVSFPELPEKEWKRISAEDHPADEKHKYAYTFEVYERK